MAKQSKIVSTSGEIIKTRKKRTRSKQPQVPINITWLKQSNLITLMRCDYGVLHYKVLIGVVEKLQKAMDESINGLGFEQLTLFKEFDSNNKLMLSVQYRDLGVSPDHYHQIKKVLKDLATIPVELDTLDPLTGAPAWSVSGLFKAYIPKSTYSKYCSIEIEKEVAKALVDMTKGFTKYGKEIATNAKSKYTIRMYLLISSWKTKGGFSMTMDKFRHWLELENKYPDYKDLYRWVIKPAYDELYEASDCWFELAEVYKEGEKEPFKLNFKVIKGGCTAQEKEFLRLHSESLKRMLSTHLSFTDEHLKQIMPNIDANNVLAVERKVTELFQYVRRNFDKITNIPNYCTKVILDEIVPYAEEVN